MGDDLIAKIIGHGKVKLLLNGGRVRTLHGVMHIPYLARNIICVSKMGDASVHTVLGKETYKII